MAARAGHRNQPQAFIIPYMAKGHTLPLLDLAKTLANRGIRVSIITTEGNLKQVDSYTGSLTCKIIYALPFPKYEGLPQGIENTDQITQKSELFPFIKATLQLEQDIRLILEGQVKFGHDVFVIADVFMGWTLSICHSLNIPGLLFHPTGVVPTTILRTAIKHPECVVRSNDQEEPADAIHLPGLSPPFSLLPTDFPELIDENNAVGALLSELQGDASCYWGVVVNSFLELEGEDQVRHFQSLFPEGVKVWCVGPVAFYSSNEDQERISSRDQAADQYMKWLDDKMELEPLADGVDNNKVIYVSFGTQAHMSDTQMDEIALGLEMAGTPFIWAVKSRTWNPPKEWENRVKARGLVLREWAEQRSILAHPAIGGFFSHCGWNSVMESLAMGVPLLAFPLGAEQPLNTKLVVEVLEAGIAIEGYKEAEVVVVGKEVICKGVKELMCRGRGKMVKEKAREIGILAKKAVGENGSSSKMLDQMIMSLKKHITQIK